MRVGIVTTSYPRFAGDAAGHFVQAHAQALARAGHAIEVIAADDAAAEPAPGVHRVAAHPGLFYAGGAPDALERGSPRVALAATAFSARLAAAVVARASRWDAIIAHWLAPAALAALPARAPLLAIAHGGDVFTLRRLGLLAPALHALRLRRARLAFVSAELLAVARAAAARSPALARYLGAAVVQPMGIDAAGAVALPHAPTTPATVLLVARLAPIKGVDVALAALAHLRTPIHLLVAGDGPEAPALRALAATALPRHRVEFVGAVPTAALAGLLARASAVLVPSRALSDGRTEGTPLIALEALAAGVPVIASATGGLRALAPAAVLVPPEQPAALAAALDRVLAAPPAPAGLRAAVAHLDWARVATVLAPTQVPA